MKANARKIAEILLVAGIVALSVAICLFRDRIQAVGSLGYVGLFLLCFLANATVFLPAPSLMLAASAALVMNPWLVALVASLGSALGEFVGYVFGSATKDLSPKFQKLLEKLQQKVPNETVLVFVLALLPLPLFDVVGVYAGGTKMHLVRFFAACFVGKFTKMLVYTRLYDILAWVITLPHNAWLSKFLPKT
ncbi:MAG: DedA family protein [Clostridia bacterium]|nr:DedA family protein [Clostridia bacterium]